jgi:hypothetical protein
VKGVAMQERKYCLRGGLIGLLVPLILLVIFKVLAGLNIELGRFHLTALIVFALAILELPVAIIGRSLGLPIETGDAAFIFYEFNALGYVLTAIFWILVGVFIGWLISRKRCKKE